MSLLKWGFVGLLILPVAEVAAFILVALAIGWGWAFALFIATSLAGLLVLQRAGRSGRAELERLRAAASRDGMRAARLDSSPIGSLIGGILLVLPGFITDAVGALLLIPKVRRWAGATLSGAFRNPHRQRDPSIVDLEPQEWHPMSDGELEDRRKRRPERTRS